MTAEMALVFGILAAAVVLFVTEWLRMDLVALLVLVTLGLTGLVPAADVFAGFSSPAVITVWAMFILSGALTLTGVAERIGTAMTRVAGTGEIRLIAVIMATAALLSSVMNNVGVAALMLPVVINVARQTGRSPSRLLMPLSVGILLGGLTTLIGTPPNILVSEALREQGERPFAFFEFMPIGGPLVVVGIVFVALIGRHLLPERDPVREAGTPRGTTRGLYELAERLFTVRIPPDSPLDGRTLAQSRLGSALRLNVVAVQRSGRTRLAPTPGTVVHGGDRLLAIGRLDLVNDLLEGPEPLAVVEADGSAELILAEAEPVELAVPQDSSLVGSSLVRAALRRRFGVNVVSIRRGASVLNAGLHDVRIQAGDALLVQGPREAVDTLAAALEIGPAAPVSAGDLRRIYRLHERLLALHVPADSVLAGRTLADARLGDALGFTVWAIRRGGEMRPAAPDEVLRVGDTLLAEGSIHGLEMLRALRELEIESRPIQDIARFASARIGLAEVVLSPQTTLEGRSLRDLEFRDRYGLSVLAIWRRDRAYRTGLRDMQLRFGDALLVHGPTDHVRRLARDPDFIVVSETVPTASRPEKGPLAVLIMALMLVPVVAGWLPIAIASVTGAALMVLLRCLTMEEAYRFIDWPVVFLIAGMLPLGVALDQTGAAQLVANGIIATTAGLGPHGALAGLFLLAALAKVVVPAAALAVIMIPIAFSAAADLGVSPMPFFMTIAVAVSASFVGPIAHPANTIIMGPGGYRFSDYLRLGLPMTLIVFVVTVLLVPVLWPFAR